MQYNKNIQINALYLWKALPRDCSLILDEGKYEILSQGSDFVETSVAAGYTLYSNNKVYKIRKKLEFYSVNTLNTNINADFTKQGEEAMILQNLLFKLPDLSFEAYEYNSYLTDLLVECTILGEPFKFVVKKTDCKLDRIVNTLEIPKATYGQWTEYEADQIRIFDLPYSESPRVVQNVLQLYSNTHKLTVYST